MSPRRQTVGRPVSATPAAVDDDAVDAVGASVGEHLDVGPSPAEPLDVAHRHRRGDHQCPAGGDGVDDGPGDGGLGARPWPGGDHPGARPPAGRPPPTRSPPGPPVRPVPSAVSIAAARPASGTTRAAILSGSIHRRSGMATIDLGVEPGQPLADDLRRRGFTQPQHDRRTAAGEGFGAEQQVGVGDGSTGDPAARPVVGQERPAQPLGEVDDGDRVRDPPPGHDHAVGGPAIRAASSLTSGVVRRWPGGATWCQGRRRPGPAAAHPARPPADRGTTGCSARDRGDPDQPMASATPRDASDRHEGAAASSGTPGSQNQRTAVP